jgi:5-methylcytosine-specific restriction endonuclease McrA
MPRPHSKLDDLTKEQRDELIARLNARQQGKCFICGDAINLQLDEVDIDHIVPISPPFKGVDYDQNWAIAHANHNRSKGNKSLELTRYIFQYRKQRDLNVNKNKDFTVGDALDNIVPIRQDIYADLSDNDVTISYIGQDGISKKEEFSLMKDDGQSSFVGMIPFKWIYHDKTVNPRSIADLEPMIEEFYNQYPQLQPSIAHMEIVAQSHPCKIMLFDGQHKAAAQLFNNKERLLTRVFVNTDIRLLKDTNFRAHTVVAQVHFPDIIEDKVGRDLFKQGFDVYVAQTDPDKGSEEGFVYSLDNASDYREHLRRYIKYESLFNEGQRHKILNYVETVWARSKKFPLVYDTLDKTFFRFFLYLQPSEDNLRESEKYRKLERQNISKLMDIFVEEILDNRFDTDVGIFKLEQQVAQRPDSVPNNHLAAYRICRAPSMITWMDQLQKAIVLLLRGHPGYVNDEWGDERPFWIDISAERWEKIRKMFKFVREHQIWIEKSNKEIMNAIAATKQSDWREILLNGRLPDRAQALYSPLTYTRIHEYAIR